MALLNLGDDPWLKEYESCEKLHRDIMEQLTIRQTLPRQTDCYNQLSAQIRLRLKQFKNELSQLDQKIQIITNSRTITVDESERRSRQLELLRSKRIQMQQLFDSQIMDRLKEDRNQLLDKKLIGEMSNVQNITVNDVRDNQSKMLKHQNEGLENLSQIISRQKNIAQTISNEVDLHNEILEDLGSHIDRTDDRVRNETQHVSIVDRKDNTCIYWVIIILLFFSIVIVAAIN